MNGPERITNQQHERGVHDVLARQPPVHELPGGVLPAVRVRDLSFEAPDQTDHGVASALGLRGNLRKDFVPHGVEDRSHPHRGRCIRAPQVGLGQNPGRFGSDERAHHGGVADHGLGPLTAGDQEIGESHD